MNIMNNLNLQWVKCENKVWCSFNNLNITHEYFNDLKGVYIIWSNNKVIRIGSGIIRNRIIDHRTNVEIIKYHDLKVTWARVNANQMEGVEKYLADTLNKGVGERLKERTTIKEKLQW